MAKWAECPFIKIRIKNESVNRLVDMGAYITVISKEFNCKLMENGVKFPTLLITGLKIIGTIGNKTTKLDEG